jgi:transposase InsO family protein
MCALLGVSRALVFRRPKAPARPGLLDAIESIVTTFLGYGYRRVHRELARRGVKSSTHAVRKLLREQGLLARQPRSKGITKRDPRARRYANLVKHFAPSAKDQVWVADLTQIRTDTGPVYMASVVDLYSRKVLSWRISRSPDTRLSLACLEAALELRRPAPGWIHHSDQGSTYTAGEYVSRIRASGGRVSMSRTGCPYDNAVMESFYRTLKLEEVRPNHYRSFLELETSLDDYIQLYNERRMHSSLDYLSPDEFEALHTGDTGP